MMPRRRLILLPAKLNRSHKPNPVAANAQCGPGSGIPSLFFCKPATNCGFTKEHTLKARRGFLLFHPSGAFAMDAIKIKLFRDEVPVEVQMTKDGEPIQYTIKEMVEIDKEQYMQKMNSRFVDGKDGKSTVKSFQDIQGDLVSKCLHDADGAPVKIEVIRKFPVAAVEALFKACQTLNALDKKGEGEENAKKD